MTHDDHILSLLQEYLDGTLTIRERLSVEEHMQSCPQCTRACEQYRVIRLTAESLPKHVEPQHDLWPGIESRIRRPARIAAIFDLALRRNGYRAAAREEATGARSRRGSAARWSLGAAAVIAAGFFGWSVFHRSAAEDLPSWQVTRVEGNPLIDEERIEGSASLHKGDWLETDGSSRAEITVGSIGRVDVGPNTRIRLVEASDIDHRLSLAQGEIHATVSAPPRLFFVETPSALAVDLGCSYALRVAGNGDGILEVTAGYVAFESRGRRAVVPAGMLCLTRPGSGPGTPYLENAPESFRKALEDFDFSGGTETALSNVLAGSRGEDAITLWHLLFRVGKEQRGPVFDRIARLVAPPEGTTRDGVLAGDPAMISAWQDQVGLGPVVVWAFAP